MTNKRRRRIAGEQSAAQRTPADSSEATAPTEPGLNEPSADDRDDTVSARRRTPRRVIRPTSPAKTGLQPSEVPAAHEGGEGPELEDRAPVDEDRVGHGESARHIEGAPAVAPGAGGDGGAHDVWHRPAIVAAVALFLGGALMLAYGWVSYSDPAGEDATGELREREQAAVAAATAIETLFTFGEESGEEYRAAFAPLATAHAVESTEVGTYLERVAEGVDEGVIAAEVSPVIAAAIECGQDCADDTVEVLVVFDHQPQVIGEGALPPRHYRLEVLMRLEGGAWKIDDIDFIGADAAPVD